MLGVLGTIVPMQTEHLTLSDRAIEEGGPHGQTMRSMTHAATASSAELFLNMHLLQQHHGDVLKAIPFISADLRLPADSICCCCSFPVQNYPVRHTTATCFGRSSDVLACPVGENIKILVVDGVFKLPDNFNTRQSGGFSCIRGFYLHKV